MSINKGLIIKSPWIDYILSGEKIWEIRGNATRIRGRIGLIKSGSGTLLGEVSIIDCLELDLQTYKSSSHKHRIDFGLNSLPYKKTFAWVLDEPITYDKPIKYNHPWGAIIWVNLDHTREK